MIRRLIALVLCLLLVPAFPVHATPSTTAADVWKVEAAPRGWAGASVLLDWKTGEILFARNAHQRRSPASTTKVLTALIALERGDLNDLVKVSRRAAYTEGSSMYIKPGEVYSLHDLLHGLLLRSGNDAAVAIAEHLAGSVEAFAILMNDRAKALGAKGSHFVNPHGLSKPEHYSTAYDLAVITRAALNNPKFAEIVSQPARELTFEELERRTVLYNTNKLLGWLPGADGVKTGTTAAAGPCLIASATRDGQKLISVVLNSGNRWRESADLLEWGFRNFQVAQMGQKGEVLRSVPVYRGKRLSVPVALKEDLELVLPRKMSEYPAIQISLNHPEIPAPIRQGQRVGSAVIALPDGRDVTAELVAAESVAKATWLDLFYRFLVSLVEQAPPE